MPSPHAGPATSSGKTLDVGPAYPCAKLKLDQLFLHWLALPDSQTLVSRAAHMWQVLACNGQAFVPWHAVGSATTTIQSRCSQKHNI